MEFIDPKKIFGLGTGSTVNLLINKIHETFILNGQSITAESTSEETTDLATKLGIDIIDLDQVNELDVVIDGADEVDSHDLTDTKAKRSKRKKRKKKKKTDE